MMRGCRIMRRDLADELAISLSRLNDGYRSPKYRAILAAASFALTFCLFLTHTEIRYGLNSVPVWALDEMDYDSIGWELAQGSGFLLEFTDPLPALIALINFMLVDERTRVYARSLYTESLGAFVIAVIACLLIGYAKRPRIAVIVAAGLTMGFGVLTRNIFALWLPVLAAWIVWWRPRDVPFGRRLGFAVTFLTVALLVMSPWMIRNVRCYTAFSRSVLRRAWMQLPATAIEYSANGASGRTCMVTASTILFLATRTASSGRRGSPAKASAGPGPG
jgi:hypothetical protein